MSQCENHGTIYVEFGGNTGSPIDGYCYQCEIDRLKDELESKNNALSAGIPVLEEAAYTITTLERQLDASRALLAEAKTANLAIRLERDQAVAQLHAELIEARAEVERLKPVAQNQHEYHQSVMSAAHSNNEDLRADIAMLEEANRTGNEHDNRLVTTWV